MIKRGKQSKKFLLKKSILKNSWIRAPKLRVLDEEGNFLGELSREEALNKARMAGLDLVEIAPMANPPVAKIIDFNKYLYQVSKKERRDKKTKTELKEIKIGMFMGENDEQRFAKRASDFLEQGNQVRISLWLQGRELGKKDLARKYMGEFIAKIPNGKIVSGPSMQGKVMRTVISFEKQKHEQT